MSRADGAITCTVLDPAAIHIIWVVRRDRHAAAKLCRIATGTVHTVPSGGTKITSNACHEIPGVIICVLAVKDCLPARGHRLTEDVLPADQQPNASQKVCRKQDNADQEEQPKI